MGLEKIAEKKLIASIHNQGMSAWHMDCSVDGFCDILAVGEKNLSFFCEVKHGPLTKKLFHAFEDSQPIFMMLVEKTGYRNIFQCLYDGKFYHLYQIPNLWKVCAYDEKSFMDFPVIISSHHTEVVVKKMIEVACGR